jgi:hypothetical protein
VHNRTIQGTNRPGRPKVGLILAKITSEVELDQSSAADPATKKQFERLPYHFAAL